MEQEIQNFFDGVTMPQRCAEKIMSRAAGGPKNKHKEVYTMRQTEEKGRFRWVGVAVCLVALTVMGMWFFNPDREAVIQASNPTVLEDTAETTNPQEPWLPYYVDAMGRVIINLDVSVEVTDKLSYDTPVIYCEEAEDGTIRYLAMGKSDAGDGVGIYYVEYSTDGEEGSPLSLNFKNEEGQDYGWYTLGLEKMEQHVNAIRAGRHKNTAGSVASDLRLRGLMERDGRLYFLDGDKEQDITDLISDEEPFLYSYVDANGMEHCVAVGGTYTPNTDMHGVYWVEVWKDAIIAENLRYAMGAWKEGRAHGHWDNETEDYFGWYKKAKEYFGWPWG